MPATYRKAVDPADGTAVARLANEARVLAELAHPDVVELVGWDPSNGELLTALAGRHTLADLDPTDATQVAVRLARIAGVLGELHDAGWSHGRVRPDHVVVGSGQRLTLCSLGAAARRSPGHPALVADHHDLATLGRVLLERLDPAAGRGERRARTRLAAVLDTVSRAPDLPTARAAWAQLDDRGHAEVGVTSATRLLGTAVLGTGLAAVLWWAGHRLGPTAPPPSAAAAVEVVRWAALAALAYLSIVAALAGVAMLVHAGDAARAILRAAPAPVRRLLGGLVGAGMLSMLAPRGPAPAPAPPATATATPSTTTTTATTATATATTPTTTTATTPTTATTATTTTTTTAPPGPTDTVAPMPAPTPGRATATTTLGPGDHLWAVAERTLAERLGRTPTEREVGRYWVRLVGLNRSRLVDPANPDLVLVGQVVELPD